MKHTIDAQDVRGQYDRAANVSRTGKDARRFDVTRTVRAIIVTDPDDRITVNLYRIRTSRGTGDVAVTPLVTFGADNPDVMAARIAHVVNEAL